MNASAHSAALPVRQSLDRRRVYIFLTRHGFMLGSMMFVILLGSINYDNALGYLLTFLLFGLFLVTMLHTYRYLAGLAYLGAEAKPVFAGEPAVFVLGFDNRGHWQRHSIEFAHWPPRQGRWWRRRRAITPGVATIAADKHARVALRLPSATRGWLPLRRIRLTSTFPLGILRAWAYFEDPAACLVYPRAEGPLPLPADGLTASSAIGGVHQGHDDFAGFRPYQPGDPIRAIAWKNLARADVLLVKRFTSGAAERIMLTWQHSARLTDQEARLSQLAAWILEAERLGLHYGLDLPGTHIPPAAGAAHRHECLKVLALFAA
jgi:uncharacterized protein (DUF58 family)